MSAMKRYPSGKGEGNDQKSGGAPGKGRAGKDSSGRKPAFGNSRSYKSNKPFGEEGSKGERTERSRKPFEKGSGGEEKPRPFRSSSESRPSRFPKRDDGSSPASDKRSDSRTQSGDRPYRGKKSDEWKKEETFKPRRFKKDDTEKREGDSTHTREYKKGYGDKPYAEREGKREYKPGRRTSDKEAESGTRPDRKAGRDYTSVRPPRFRNEKAGSSAKPKGKRGFGEDGTIRLNKYLANAGICSRREADTLIESGAVSVNGKVVTLLGTRISMDDKVQFGGETLSIERKVYLLLNKPKGYITTVDDPQDRNTVMMLVKDACRERIYPVGRLDRNTTGLLLFTNDGELAKKLTHPGHKVRKVYHVELNKGLAKSDMARLSEGIELEDGMMAVDEIAYTGSGDDKKNIGVVIHSGRNRVVRRMFESLDYEVTKLDRVAFANLTKKDLPRGRWRFLEQTEINMLMII